MKRRFATTSSWSARTFIRRRSGYANVRPAIGSRLRSSGWPAVTRGYRHSRGPVAAGRRGSRRSFPASRTTAAGTSTRSTTPTRTAPAPRTPARAGSCVDAASSTRRSSASARARRWRWIRSSGCCWRRRGRRSSGPGSTRRRCAAAGPVCSSAATARTTVPGLAEVRGAARGLPGHRQRGQRRLRPDLVHASAWRARR